MTAEEALALIKQNYKIRIDFHEGKFDEVEKVFSDDDFKRIAKNNKVNNAFLKVILEKFDCFSLKNMLRTVNYLITKGIRTNIVSDDGWTPIIGILFEYRVNSYHDDIMLPDHAKGYAEVIKFMVKNRANVNSIYTYDNGYNIKYITALSLAIECKSKELILELLKLDGDIDKHAIPYALYDEDLFELIENNCDKTLLFAQNGSNLLFEALMTRKENHWENLNDIVIKKLINDYGYEINGHYNYDDTSITPILFASKMYLIGSVKYLIKNGANINEVDESTGETPFSLVLEESSEHNIEMLQFMLDNGADPNYVKNDGSTWKDCSYLELKVDEFMNSLT